MEQNNLIGKANNKTLLLLKKLILTFDRFRHLIVSSSQKKSENKTKKLGNLNTLRKKEMKAKKNEKVD